MGGKSTGYMSSRSGIMSSASKKNAPSSGTGDKPSGRAPVQVRSTNQFIKFLLLKSE
jgi:hypothetical protein